MIGHRDRFTPLQRLLHWLMAVCIFTMLFIGVGMVSTVKPKYLMLVSIHKPLGIAILVLALVRLVVRLRYGAPSLPADLPEPMRLGAQLSHYALYALMIGMPLLGWGMLSAATTRSFCSRACTFQLLWRRTTACIRCSGMRISNWPSCSLPSSFCMWRRRCSTRSCDATAYSMRWRPCRLTTRSRPPGDRPFWDRSDTFRLNSCRATMN
jgi:cytochrome b561